MKIPKIAVFMLFYILIPRRSCLMNFVRIESFQRKTAAVLDLINERELCLPKS